ncbi:MAG TPA: NAD(P)-dependent oxidoreductase [Bacteroidia bacterium]|jgi:nucleoside-diphosphate-sugar epimerase|nr:NAD(P)-dependent oxidoreductase [Bacteroidia bacterium]
MPTVIITGANGFLGAYLVKYFNQKEWKVRALVHNEPKEKLQEVEYFNHDLSLSPEQNHFEGADCFIHCAYTKGSVDVNIKGTIGLLEMSRKSGVKKNIFISSISSNEHALSIYLKQKWACEKLFNQPNDLILRPGLILGNGGLFGQMRDYLKKKSLIPIISGGQQSMQTIYVEDLAQAIYNCIDKNISGIFTVASPEKLSYKEFYTLLCSSLNAKPTFISIPFGLLYFFLSITETLGFKLAISRENLLGLKQLKYVDTTKDIKEIGINLKECRESLKTLV